MRLQENWEDLERQMAKRIAELHESNQRLREEIAECRQAEALLRERERQYRNIFDSTPDGIVLLEVTADLRFRIISINPAFEKIAQIASADLVGKYIEDYFPADKAQALTTVFRRCVELGVSVDYDSSYAWPAGFREDSATVIPIRDDGQRIHRIAVITRDDTQRRSLERALRKREAEMRTMIENSPDCIARYDADARIVYVNAALERTMRVPREQMLGKRVDERYPDNPVMLRFQKVIEQVIATGRPAEFEVTGDVDGFDRQLYDQVRFAPEMSDDGKVVGAIAIGRDFTRQKQLEEELRQRESEFRELVEHSPDTIARYDRECRRIYANPKLLAVLGGDPAQVLGKTPEQHPGGESARIYQRTLREVLECGERRDIELPWQVGDKVLCNHICMIPESDASGQATHVLVVGRDITEIDQYRKKIHHQAFYDALTGLPNRSLLSDRISQEIADAKYHGRQFGLIMLDLDHFKEINDTLGHSVGDRLLADVAGRMQASVRVYDTVARLGGDEFAILLSDVRKGDDLATIARKILQQFVDPFVIDGRELFVTASIGIALYPCDSEEIDALYKYADSAMYHAKKMGRNNFQFYAREFTLRSLERMETEAALRKAQKHGELALYYQPQIDLQSGCLVGAEALLRWCRPGHGLVGPDRFIQLAEDTGLILDIGEWVLANACQAAVSWNRGRKDLVRIAVNVSTRQFVRNDLVGTVSRILSETGCSPAWLKLEITESLLLEDSPEVASALESLHGMGLSISIDDFGTGYSALSYLHRFPVGQIKIDRSFVSGITEQRDKRELVKVMLSIASTLGLESVAEGVETPQQAEYLTAHGCRQAQGYLFGKPMPAAEFESVLAREDKA